MRGVVLCGGQSTRMGCDKGLLKQSNFSWAEIAASQLSTLQIPVVVSVNEKQATAYSKIFSSRELIVDDENMPVKGPLLGLLSVHYQFPNENLFVLACDMIEMNGTLLQNLLDSYKQTSHEAYVYSTGEKLQPLCGIYASSGLQRISQLLQRQKLKKFSMMYVLECLNTKYIPVEASLFNFFNNYNSPEELIS